jgi:hypothetical protein
MRYQIPAERPPGRFAKYAARATAPYWAALVSGALPGLIWSAANAHFLGCRDAQRQGVIALIGYVLVAGVEAGRFWAITSGTLAATFGSDARLASWLLITTRVVVAMCFLRYLAGRQVDVAAYRSSLGTRLPWAFPVVAALAAFNYFVIDALFELTPHVMWVWGPMFF